MEKEREFYFSKLREIEIYIQNELEVNGADLSAKETSSLKDIQAIMYKTEDGFEVPQEGAAATATGMDEDIAAATEPAAVEMY